MSTGTEVLRRQSIEELEELEKNTGRDLFDAKLKNYTNQLDDTSKIRKLRRDLARVKTVLGQMRREETEPKAG